MALFNVFIFDCLETIQSSFSLSSNTLPAVVITVTVPLGLPDTALRIPLF